MSTKTSKSTLIIFLTMLLILILIEPSVAEDSEFENIDWSKLFKEFLNLFAKLLEQSANLVRDSAELIVELFEESE